jgi:enoyl-CoA hydratase/carnithine racemase
MSSKVEIRRRGHVAEIVFSRPPNNFASSTLLAEIADAVALCDDNDEVRCTVLSSEGRSFCAGADLAGDEDVTGGEGMATIGQFYVQAERLFRRRKPMVAAVQGAAIGAGLGLALAADFRVASPAARFSANFVRLGFHPGFAITCTLPRLIGETRAGWMMLSAERTKAEQAREWGLVDRLADADALIDEAHAMAAEIAVNAPLALLAVRATWIGDMADRAAAAMRREHAEQTALKSTQDYAEGVASVFERREANFVGR